MSKKKDSESRLVIKETISNLMHKVDLCSKPLELQEILDDLGMLRSKTNNLIEYTKNKINLLQEDD